MQTKYSTGNKYADLAILALVLYLVYRIVKVFTEGLSGIEKTFGVDKESKELEAKADETSRAAYFDPETWYKTLVKKGKTNTTDKVRASITATVYTGTAPSLYAKIIKSIYDAKAGIRIGTIGIGGGSGGGLGQDNEEAIINIFKSANSQFEISLISYLFAKEYGRDLFAYLDSFVTNKTIDSIRRIAEGKPVNPSKLK